MIFIFDGLPVAKPRQTQSDKWKKRPAVTKYRGFADEIRAKLAVQGFFTFKNITGLKITYYISPSKKREKEVWDAEIRGSLIYHDQKPDIDNLVKATLDALFTEDKKIHTIIATKFYRIKPGIRIEILIS